MKKVALCIIGIVMVLSLAACGSDNHQDGVNQKQENSNRFQITGEFYYIGDTKFDIVKDSETNNLYLYNDDWKGAYQGVLSMTPLYDENGEIEKAQN